MSIQTNSKIYDNGRFNGFDSIKYTERAEVKDGFIEPNTILKIIGYNPTTEKLRLKFKRNRVILKSIYADNVELANMHQTIQQGNRQLFTGAKGGIYYLTKSNRKKYIKQSNI